MWISRISVLEKLFRRSRPDIFITTLVFIIAKLIRKIIRICNDVYFMILILGLKFIQIGVYE
jgi:hypothetical protein